MSAHKRLGPLDKDIKALARKNSTTLEDQRRLCEYAIKLQETPEDPMFDIDISTVETLLDMFSKNRFDAHSRRWIGVLLSKLLHTFERLRDEFSTKIVEELKRSLGSVFVLPNPEEIKHIGASIIRSSWSLEQSELPLETFWPKDIADIVRPAFRNSNESQFVSEFDDVIGELTKQGKGKESLTELQWGSALLADAVDLTDEWGCLMLELHRDSLTMIAFPFTRAIMFLDLSFSNIDSVRHDRAYVTTARELANRVEFSLKSVQDYTHMLNAKPRTCSTLSVVIANEGQAENFAAAVKSCMVQAGYPTPYDDDPQVPEVEQESLKPTAQLGMTVRDGPDTNLVPPPRSGAQSRAKIHNGTFYISETPITVGPFPSDDTPQSARTSQETQQARPPKLREALRDEAGRTPLQDANLPASSRSKKKVASKGATNDNASGSKLVKPSGKPDGKLGKKEESQQKGTNKSHKESSQPLPAARSMEDISIYDEFPADDPLPTKKSGKSKESSKPKGSSKVKASGKAKESGKVKDGKAKSKAADRMVNNANEEEADEFRTSIMVDGNPDGPGRRTRASLAKESQKRLPHDSLDAVAGPSYVENGSGESDDDGGEPDEAFIPSMHKGKGKYKPKPPVQAPAKTGQAHEDKRQKQPTPTQELIEPEMLAATTKSTNNHRNGGTQKTMTAAVQFDRSNFAAGLLTEALTKKPSIVHFDKHGPVNQGITPRAMKGLSMATIEDELQMPKEGDTASDDVDNDESQLEFHNGPSAQADQIDMDTEMRDFAVGDTNDAASSTPRSAVQPEDAHHSPLAAVPEEAHRAPTTVANDQLGLSPIPAIQGKTDEASIDTTHEGSSSPSSSEPSENTPRAAGCVVEQRTHKSVLEAVDPDFHTIVEQVIDSAVVTVEQKSREPFPVESAPQQGLPETTNSNAPGKDERLNIAKVAIMSIATPDRPSSMTLPQEYESKVLERGLAIGVEDTMQSDENLQSIGRDCSVPKVHSSRATNLTAQENDQFSQQFQTARDSQTGSFLESSSSPGLVTCYEEDLQRLLTTSTQRIRSPATKSGPESVPTFLSQDLSTKSANNAVSHIPVQTLLKTGPTQPSQTVAEIASQNVIIPRAHKQDPRTKPAASGNLHTVSNHATDKAKPNPAAGSSRMELKSSHDVSAAASEVATAYTLQNYASVSKDRSGGETLLPTNAETSRRRPAPNILQTTEPVIGENNKRPAVESLPTPYPKRVKQVRINTSQSKQPVVPERRSSPLSSSSDEYATGSQMSARVDSQGSPYPTETHLPLDATSDKRTYARSYSLTQPTLSQPSKLAKKLSEERPVDEPQIRTYERSVHTKVIPETLQGGASTVTEQTTTIGTMATTRMPAKVPENVIPLASSQATNAEELGTARVVEIVRPVQEVLENIVADVEQIEEAKGSRFEQLLNSRAPLPEPTPATNDVSMEPADWNDVDETLVEEPPASKQRRASVRRDSSSIDDDVSTSDEEDEKKVSEAGTEPDDTLMTAYEEEMEWETQVLPHQKTLMGAVMRCAQRLCIHFHDQETATTQIVADYRVNGKKLIAQMLQYHQEEYDKCTKAYEIANVKAVEQLVSTSLAVEREKKQMAAWRERLGRDEREFVRRGKEGLSGVAELLAVYGGI